jgi:1-deoxy-D-xylulose-5-phosphate reductoisomerase
VALSAYSNFKLLESQIRKYKPLHVAVGQEGLEHFKSIGIKGVKLYPSRDCARLASLKEVDAVVLAMSGTGALMPFLAAIRAGKTVAPANKEALVIAGSLIMEEARKYKARIIPIDSEQSAIYQCLEGQLSKPVFVHLTASGGPLREVNVRDFGRMTPRDILRHPRWKMGPKITVDSATMMNKGFEVIEAMHLFGLKHDQIKVLVHPQAVIHSMIEFADGSQLAQLGVTDMRLPIQYALTYPERLPTGLKSLDLARLKSLDFQKPDLERFPCLKLAIKAARLAGTMPAVLNAADEIAVEAFLKGKIDFITIYKVVEKVVLHHTIVKNPSLQAILLADQWARQEAMDILEKQ